MFKSISYQLLSKKIIYVKSNKEYLILSNDNTKIWENSCQQIKVDDKSILVEGLYKRLTGKNNTESDYLSSKTNLNVMLSYYKRGNLNPLFFHINKINYEKNKLFLFISKTKNYIDEDIPKVMKDVTIYIDKNINNTLDSTVKLKISKNLLESNLPPSLIYIE